MVVSTRSMTRLAGENAGRRVVALSLPVVMPLAMTATFMVTKERLGETGGYVTLWPENPWLGWVWPAVGFGAWHVAPQVIHPAGMGPLAYVVSATALGLSWGWVAWRTTSIRWTMVSHVFTDASGLRNALFFIGG